MNFTISSLARSASANAQTAPGRACSEPMGQLLGKVLAGEALIQWIELPTKARVDRQALEMTSQRLRRYLQWMTGGPVLTILHATPSQAHELQGLSESYLAITAGYPGAGSQLRLFDNQLQPAWPQTLALPLALAVHGLSPAQIAQRVAETNPAQPHGTALLLCDTPPRHDGSLWLFDPGDNLRNIRSAIQPGSRPHGLVHRWQAANYAAAVPPLPAPTDFERELQLCSHLAQAFKEPICA